jgi:hypothetical protein
MMISRVYPSALSDLRPGLRLADPTRDDEWRDEHIIPRYNAGVRRFAFLYPDGVPLIGTPPGPMGPSTFPTGYFGRRQAALDWPCE